MKAGQLIDKLKSLAAPRNVEGMARFGINTRNTLGVRIPVLRKMAKEIGKDHALALALWESDIHEARILAALIDDPAEVTDAQMESWAARFDSWDICDGVVCNLFDKTPRARAKAAAWAKRDEEYVKRNGALRRKAIALAEEILAIDAPAARWIARDAIRELARAAGTRRKEA
ncbi:MAG TPA: DNA alkylation repair protein [bacterium]|nr:DNA alkylation repair protein [bacterium]